MKQIVLITSFFLLTSLLFSQEASFEDFYFSSSDEEIAGLLVKALSMGESDPAEQLLISTDAYNLAVEHDSFSNKADALVAMGIAYFNLQEFDKSIQVLTESYDFSKQINYNDGKWNSAYHLGTLYSFLDDSEKAINHFEEADELLSDIYDPRHILSYRELAKIYKEDNSSEKALFYASSALEIADELIDTESALGLSLLMGEIYFQGGDIRSSNHLFKTIIDETTSFGDFQSIRASALSQSGKCYALLGEYNLALANGQDSLLLSAKNNSVDGRVEAYDSLAFIYRQMDNYKEAFSNLQLYYSEKAILEKENRNSNLSKIKAYYQTFEKEQEIDKQQQQIEIQKRILLTGSIVLTFLAVLILIFYMLYRKNSKAVYKLNHELKKEMAISRTDRVTGLPNRKYMEDSIRKAIVKWKMESRIFSLIFLSFESFRNIDKEYGSGTGEDIQKSIGKILKIELKGQDVISLWKPFLFLLLLPETDSESIQAVKSRLVSKISKEVFTKNEKIINLSFKVGLFTYTGEGNRVHCIEKCSEDLRSD